MPSIYHAYEEDEHRHRFAIWAAARSAFRGVRGAGLSQSAGWLKASGLSPVFQLKGYTGDWSKDQSAFDGLHGSLRRKVIHAASGSDSVSLSHGRAAKAISVYLKTRFVIPEPGSIAARVIHPPVDRLLLLTLSNKSTFWKNRLRNPRTSSFLAWTTLGNEEYENLISDLRSELGELPFWRIEALWNPASQ